MTQRARAAGAPPAAGRRAGSSAVATAVSARTLCARTLCARALCASALSATALVGCGSSHHGPSAADFAAGPCRSAAPAALGVLGSVRAGNKHPDQPQRVEPAMTTWQHQLEAVLPTAGARRQRVQDVVTAIGGFRLQTDSHTYHPQLLQGVEDADNALVTDCTQKMT